MESYKSAPGGDAIDFNVENNHIIQWIFESERARREYMCLLYRVKLAMMGKPSKNLYQDELTSNISKISDEKKKDAYTKACLTVPEGRSFAIRNAVKTRATQMSGGVDTYEYQINDPYGIIEDDTEALLATTCQQDYITNHLDRLVGVFSRDLTEAGISATLVKYCPEKDENRVLRVNPKNIWFDTKYSAVGEERFRGYSTMISWKCLKEIIKKDGDQINLNIEAPNSSIVSEGVVQEGVKISNRKIRTLNGLDIYVQNMNALATANQLAASWSTMYEEFMHDLVNCYNLNYYRTFATDSKAKTNSPYMGDDVELTVIYDLGQQIEYKVINRRYVISANSNAFHRKMVFNVYDPRTGEKHPTIKDFELSCPLKFIWEDTESRDLFPFPTSTLMTVLDQFDELCALRSKRKHVSDILSILRIETNAADANTLRGVLNIMGVVLDDIQGDINTINLAYDYTAIDSQIEYYENLIKTTLDAYNEFDALQAMGDRASAAESGMALGAVAQGLAEHQNAIMQIYADVARQCIANRVAYSYKQEFPVMGSRGLSTVTAEQMALTATINVKPKLAKKIEERLLSANAITAMGSLGQFMNAEGKAELLALALMGTVPRVMAKSFINEDGASEQEIALAQQQAQNQAQMLQQNQQAYEQNPSPYEVQNTMENYSPEQVDAIIGSMMEDQGLNSLSELDQEQMAPEEEEELGPMETPEQAGILNNMV